MLELRLNFSRIKQNVTMRGLAPSTTALGPGGSVGMPFARIESITGRLQLTYIRRKGSSSTGISYAIEFSSNLGTSDLWAVDPSATESITLIDSTLERVVVTDSATSMERFCRVRITAP